MSNTAFIALGTNIEPREQFLREALKALSDLEHVHITKKSSVYETAPVGYLNQNDFLNMVIAISTELSAEALLQACQHIEHKLGRERTIKNGPRTIDVDILLYNQMTLQTEHLTVPHPRMHERAFVLIPLYEIAPKLIIPNQADVKSLIGKLPKKDIDDVVKWN